MGNLPVSQKQKEIQKKILKIVPEYKLPLYYKYLTVIHQQKQLQRNLNITATIIY